MAFDIRSFPLFLRKLRFKHKKIINSDVTIISNNCTGGIMYHDLGLRFCSPTINLYFASIEEFYCYCKHIVEYSKFGKIIETNKKETKAGFPNAPIGILKCVNLPSLEIHFLHYKSFKEAKEKWIERTKRINYKKIFVVIEAVNENAAKLEIFKKLNYPIVAFTNKDIDLSFAKNMKFYKKYGADEKHPILKLVNIFGKRGYDSYNFVDEIFNYNFNREVEK